MNIAGPATQLSIRSDGSGFAVKQVRIWLTSILNPVGLKNTNLPMGLIRTT